MVRRSVDFTTAVLADDGDAVATFDSQFRSLQERMVAGWRSSRPGRRCRHHFAAAAHRRLDPQGQAGMLLGGRSRRSRRSSRVWRPFASGIVDRPCSDE